MVLMIQMIQKWFKISTMTKNSQNSKKFEKPFSNLSEFCGFFVILEILNHFWIMNTILKTHFEKNTDMVLIFIWKYLPRSWIDNSYNRTASEAWLAIKKRIKLHISNIGSNRTKKNYQIELFQCYVAISRIFCRIRKIHFFVTSKHTTFCQFGSPALG